MSLENVGMNRRSHKVRVSREQWLAKALEVFTREGEPGVRIESLAREIGVAKAGFYWHFKDRDALLQAVLQYWVHEYTEVVTENPILREMEPRQRLLSMMEMISDHDLAGLDVHFTVWALKDASVARVRRSVVRKRTSFIKDIFLELGYSDHQADMRARLLAAYESNELSFHRFKSNKEASHLRELRWKLLTDND